MDRQTESSPLSSLIFDTDILIEYHRGSSAARAFLIQTPFAYRFIPSVVYMELLQGSHSSEETTHIKKLVQDNFAEIWHVDPSVSTRAIILIETYAVSHGLRMADAFIAATALEKGARLATGNVKHFKGIAGLELIPFRL